MSSVAAATGNQRAVFLDRDGVLNRVVLRDRRAYPPASAEELDFLPGVAQATADLRRVGFRLIVVTNQPDVGKGIQTRQAVEAMHERVRRSLPVDDIKVCYHVDRDECGCRKPRPGMLLAAAREWGVNLGQSYMIGDRWRDVGAGKAAGCKTVWVRCDYDEPPAEGPDAVVASLLEASGLILAGRI
jgi:D-glycero-D-manno-heptose 1,7-bisphosphate phosphatase